MYPQPYYGFIDSFIVNHTFLASAPLWWGTYLALACGAIAAMLFIAEGVASTFVAVFLGAFGIWFCGSVLNLRPDWHAGNIGFVVASAFLFVGFFAEVMFKLLKGMVYLWLGVTILILVLGAYYLLTLFAPGLITIYPSGVAVSTNMAYPGEFYDPYLNQVILPWLIILLVCAGIYFATKSRKKG